MLKINNIVDAVPNLIFDIQANDDSTQREDIYKGMLDQAVAASINGIFDNEVVEFKPQTKDVNFYMFFSAYKNIDWLEQLKPHTEESFSFHLSESLRKLATSTKTTITNPKTLLQHTGIPIPRPAFFFHRRRKHILESLPYVVLDPVHELTYKAPTKEGIPVFYNSFSVPFAKNLGKWGDDPLGFSNKSFLYNSFLLMDFYTTNNPLTQKKIMSVPVYVNGRYMDYEQSTKKIKQIRPVMHLNNDTEGYSVVWLKQHKFTKLYVRFSFWDALNGEQIQLLPSSELMVEKKWVQNPNKFRQENLYLEYEFNYTNKTYSIQEYNEKSGQYDIKTNSFDLFQLVYDEYFTNMRVASSRPTNTTAEEVAGDDINLLMSRAALSKEVDAPFDDNEKPLQAIDKAYNKKHKGLLGMALHTVFQKRKVKLKDKALSYFEDKFDDTAFYRMPLGDIIITNSTENNLLIRKVEVRNVRVENKNNFIDGQPIVVNKFGRTGVDQSPSMYLCDSVVTFKGSSFYRKLNPIRRPFDQTETAIFNKQAEMYSNFYYDEENNKVVEKKAEDIGQLVKDLTETNKTNLFKNLLMGGVGVFKFIKDKKQQEAKIKGLTMGEKDLNLMLRSDVLEKSGAKSKYELLYPATNEKVVANMEKYREFGVTLKTSITPQYDEFSKGLSVQLNAEINFGKEFFKLFISANDDITITYDVAISLMDSNGKLYKKIIPCSLKYT